MVVCVCMVALIVVELRSFTKKRVYVLLYLLFVIMTSEAMICQKLLRLCVMTILSSEAMHVELQSNQVYKNRNGYAE